MPLEYRSSDWNSYKMIYNQPHRELEPPEKEIAVVAALEALVRAGILPHARYDRAKFLAHRQAVAERFEIPWTAITPRMHRLLYAINAITRPRNMIAAGVFCGNTFIANAGAAVGPGACYSAGQLIGVEIKPEEAQRAERNVRAIDPTGFSIGTGSRAGATCNYPRGQLGPLTNVARVVAADAVDVVRDFAEPINLLYLDADGAGGRGKGIYLDILEACHTRLPAGAIVLAHNSVNAAERLEHYLAFVRDGRNFHASLNVVLDGEGLEASAR